MLQRALRAKKEGKSARGEEKNGLEFKDYSGKGASFDVLWYDLSSKTRGLILDSVAPLVEDVTSHKDLLSKLQGSNDQNLTKVNELERVVYNRGKKLDIFE